MHREIKLRIFILFSILLSFIEPCSATRPLWEIVYNELYHNADFFSLPEKVFKELQSCSETYEKKILKNLHELAVALMQDLLDFLQKDALSLEEIQNKINTDGYKEFGEQRCPKDIYYFNNLSRWSFERIQSELTNPTDPLKPNFYYPSKTTLKVFRKAEPLFQEYVQACAKIFHVTEEIGKILHAAIRSRYDLKKFNILPHELYNDPWFFAAKASDGSWSTVLYSLINKGSKRFGSDETKNFIDSVNTRFSQYIDGFDANFEKRLKEEIKAQFYANRFEYLLRGVYANYWLSDQERNDLVRAIFEYARKTFDSPKTQPSK